MPKPAGAPLLSSELMDALPPELLLYLFPFLPLSSLIAARSVNTSWRSISQTTPLHPARKALLDLYLAAIVHPKFSSIIAALRPRLRTFDREAYIAGLIVRGCVLPDLFELWVLEWPSRAVYFWAWPGLAEEVRAAHDYYPEGDSLLGDPTIDPDLPVAETGIGIETCRGVALWQVQPSWSEIGEVQAWLVVSADEKINDAWMGRVIWTYSLYLDTEDDGTRRLGPKMLMCNIPLPADNLIQFLDIRLSDRPSGPQYFGRLFQRSLLICNGYMLSIQPLPNVVP